MTEWDSNFRLGKFTLWPPHLSRETCRADLPRGVLALARARGIYSRYGVSFSRLIKPSHLVPVNAL